MSQNCKPREPKSYRARSHEGLSSGETPDVYTPRPVVRHKGLPTRKIKIFSWKGKVKNLEDYRDREHDRETRETLRKNTKPERIK